MPEPSQDEPAHLIEVHHELCTALTILRSNLELVSAEVRRGVGPPQGGSIEVHVTEASRAVDRLEELARAVVVWHRRSATRQSASAEGPRS